MKTDPNYKYLPQPESYHTLREAGIDKLDVEDDEPPIWLIPLAIILIWGAVWLI